MQAMFDLEVAGAKLQAHCRHANEAEAMLPEDALKVTPVVRSGSPVRKGQVHCQFVLR